MTSYRFFWPALLFAILCFVPTFSEEAMNETGFTKLYADSLSFKLGGNKVDVVENLHLIVSKQDGGQLDVDLTSAFLDYQNKPTSISRYLASDIAILTGRIKSDVILESLIPVVRNCRLFEQFSADQRSRLFHERINDELCLFYVIDDSLSMTYLTELKALPYDSLLDLHMIGISNLWRILPEITRYNVESVFNVTAGGDYDASLLLLDDIWNHESLPVDGDYVVALPGRDILLVTGSNDSLGLRTLRYKTDSLLPLVGHPLSSKLFIKHGRNWEIFAE
jgi:uncharacterized protein YtpQ (UPF0354 family)